MKKPEDFPMPNPESESNVVEIPNPELVRKHIQKLNRAKEVMGANRLTRAVENISDEDLNVEIPEGEINDMESLTEEQKKAVENSNKAVDEIIQVDKDK